VGLKFFFLLLCACELEAMLQLTAGTTWKSTNLLALEHPPYGEVLQLSGSPEMIVMIS
jgi:hypothetical protein